ncbi:SDR family oxidoreductase [Dermacoccaceae bacterium W4C1]
MRLLVIGATGYLGSALVRHATAAGHQVIAGVHHARSDHPDTAAVDLSDASALATMLDEVRPEAVLNTAYVQSQWDVTAVGPLRLAAATRARGIALLQVSSDAVFSGLAERYDEDSEPDPVTPYGAAKAAAEVGVRALDPDASIVRTSLILGEGESSTNRLVHALVAGERDGVLFTDELRCAIHVEDLAAGMLELLGVAGLHHLTGPEPISRWEVGQLICARDGLDASRLRPGSRTELGIPGPLRVIADSARTRSRLSTRIRGAREFLAPR